MGAPCLYTLRHLGLEKHRDPSGSISPEHPGPSRASLGRGSETKAHGGNSVSGEKLHARSPAEGGVSLCPARHSLAFPGCLAFPGWHSQQCQGAGEGSTSSSTKSSLLNLFKLPFLFRSTLKRASGSSPHAPSSLQDSFCTIWSSQLANLSWIPALPEPGCTGFGSFSFSCSQKCLCHQPSGLLQRQARSVLAPTPPTQSLALQLQGLFPSVQGPRTPFIAQ